MENMRLKGVYLFVLGLFLFVACGLFKTQILEGFFYYQLSRNNRVRVVPLEGTRGRIFDRQGVVLADNRISFDVMLIPQEIKRKDEVFRYLSDILNIASEELARRFKERRFSPFTPVVVAEDIDRAKAVVLEESKFRFPGLEVEAGTKRHYPQRDIGGHLLGYVGKSSPGRMKQLKDYGYMLPQLTGKTGVEEYYDSYLRGEEGGLQIEVNNKGEQVRILSFKKSRQGQDIVLTIDSRIQMIAAQLLSGRKGAIVVLDCQNGEVLGLVSAPAYDPNVFVDDKRDRSLLQGIFEDPGSPLLNRAVSGQYPPGSVFKIPVAAAVLESNKILPATTFFCEGYYQLGQRRFQCAHVHGNQNLTEAIAHSCNVFFFNAGLLLGQKPMGDYARLFGLGRLTNIDLPYEVRGMVPGFLHKRGRGDESWRKGDTLNFSIGQGDLQATPLQLARMMAIVARDGSEVFPYLLKSVGGMENKLSTAVGRKIPIKEATLKALKAGLRATVTDYSGTAHVVDIKGLEIYGKTGTAQSSPDKPHHAWFAGFLISGQTKMAFCVFLEHGGASFSACQVAQELLLAMKEQKILQ